jgi:hypothetical protein
MTPDADIFPPDRSKPDLKVVPGMNSAEATPGNEPKKRFVFETVAELRVGNEEEYLIEG